MESYNAENRNHQSLLLFFLDGAMNQSGHLVSARMNKEDHDLAKKWTEDGFVRFGRIKFKEIEQKGVLTKAHFVELTDSAIEAAAQATKARAERNKIKE